MQLYESLFLEALKASLKNEKVSWCKSISINIWDSLFTLAEKQKVLPLIFQAVYDCQTLKQVDEQLFLRIKQRCIGLMVNQSQKTIEFLELYEKLKSQNLYPLVVKGIVCRELYPNPDLRISADEDLLVAERSFIKSGEVLMSSGMKRLGNPLAMEQADEVGFVSEQGVSYIELHKHLFPVSSEIYGNLNQYFSDVFENCITTEVQGTILYTMNLDRHLFYLICHAYKHFVGSGFGIRQVCDIIMFSNVYGQKIDWLQLLVWCKQIRAEKFAAALFKIGKKYLIFDERVSGYPKEWQAIEVDETDLLLDLLDSGIYGGSSMSRKHSSNMTLQAVAEERPGKRVKNTVICTIFPSVKKLETRFTYLKKYPFLLPVAWVERIWKYGQETRSIKENNVIEAVKIGKRRIELLKKYGIL